MRTIVDLPEQELKAIKALARRENLSQAEILRRAVRLYLESQRHELDPEAFGLWGSRTEGLEYQDSLRNEWQR